MHCMAIDIAAAAQAASDATLRPDVAFVPRCESLVGALKTTIQRLCSKGLLLEGWHLVPFGSYIQGTCLRGSTLDVALVYQGAADPRDIEANAVEIVVEHLTQHHARSFKRLPPVEGSTSLRLLAGDFSVEPHVPMQEIVLYLGDASTGVLDRSIRRMLSTCPDTDLFVLVVKHWAAQHGFASPARGGLFPWTLLALFSLQQQGVLAGFCELCGGPGAVGEQPRQEGRNLDPNFSLDYFVEFFLNYLSSPLPRPRVDLWTASLKPATGPTLAGAADTGARLDAGARAAEILEELLAPGPGPASLARATGLRPRPSIFNEFCAAAAPAAVKPPPGLPMPELHPPAGDNRLPFSELAPCTQRCAGRPQHESPPVSPQTSESQQRQKWRIDSQWVAICRKGGQILEAVQLDPSKCQELSLEAWEDRLNRREHQIRIGKATREYTLWRQEVARRGAQPGDPQTPRVAAQNSKRVFEVAYHRWRCTLHDATSALQDTSATPPPPHGAEGGPAAKADMCTPQKVAAAPHTPQKEYWTPPRPSRNKSPKAAAKDTGRASKTPRARDHN
mmetsp:Transcript_87155/g.247112  ORF Transcript_87155/g.247112 Transcript_87155/m.247112 type:complete len:561 (-) Transcript_87155:113-1795(-)